MVKRISINLSRFLIVMGLLCVLGETPLRLYGHLKLIEVRQVEVSESDLLALFDLAFGQDPFLPSPFGLPIDHFDPASPDLFQSIPLIIGCKRIPLVGRSLGGCGS